MKLTKQDLAEIIKEVINEQEPPYSGWERERGMMGGDVYRNAQTGEFSSTRPEAFVPKQLRGTAPGVSDWQHSEDMMGIPGYRNKRTGKYSYSRPEGVEVHPRGDRDAGVKPRQKLTPAEERDLFKSPPAASTPTPARATTPAPAATAPAAPAAAPARAVTPAPVASTPRISQQNLGQISQRGGGLTGQTPVSPARPTAPAAAPRSVGTARYDPKSGLKIAPPRAPAAAGVKPASTPSTTRTATTTPTPAATARRASGTRPSRYAGMSTNYLKKRGYEWQDGKMMKGGRDAADVSAAWKKRQSKPKPDPELASAGADIGGIGSPKLELPAEKTTTPTTGAEVSRPDVFGSDVSELKETKQMKLTKQNLVQIIKEELDNRDIEALISGFEIALAPLNQNLEKQINAIEGVDLSIDFLTSALTGEEAHLMKQFQSALGRGAARGVSPLMAKAPAPEPID